MKQCPDAVLLGYPWWFCLLHMAAWIYSPSWQLAVSSLNSKSSLACSEKNTHLFLIMSLWFSLSKI